MSLTTEQMVNPDRKSGYDHVQMHNDGRGKPYRAIAYTGECVKGAKDQRANTLKWMGPWRTTADLAAQDYCDHADGVAQAQAQFKLASAGHVRVRSLKPNKPTFRAIKEPKSSAGYVYCISDGTALKVGKTLNHPSNRVADLQTGNPRLLKLLGFIEVEDVNAVEVEMHGKFSHLNVLGEWFQHDDSILTEFGATDGTDVTVKN